MLLAPLSSSLLPRRDYCDCAEHLPEKHNNILVFDEEPINAVDKTSVQRKVEFSFLGTEKSCLADKIFVVFLSASSLRTRHIDHDFLRSLYLNGYARR